MFFLRNSLVTVVFCVIAALTCGNVMAQDKQLLTNPKLNTLKSKTTVKQVPSQIRSPGQSSQGEDQDEAVDPGSGPADLMSPNARMSVNSTGDFNQGSFTGDCKCCYQNGYMNMAQAVCYVRNIGTGASQPCKARLTWVNGDAPNDTQERLVDIPALAAGDQFFVNVSFSEAVRFKSDAPIRLTIDSNNQVAEADEANNVVEYDFNSYRSEYYYLFRECE